MRRGWPILLALLAAPRDAAAGMSDFVYIPNDPEWFVLLGQSIAATIDHGDVSVGLGGELSVVRVNIDEPTLWYGGYVDALYDFGADQTRVSVGPELGFLFAGVDGGLLIARPGEASLGWTVRGVATVGVATLFVRYAATFDDATSVVDVGLLMKIPVSWPDR